MPSDQSELECGDELDQWPGDSGDGVGKLSSVCVRCCGVIPPEC